MEYEIVFFALWERLSVENKLQVLADMHQVPALAKSILVPLFINKGDTQSVYLTEIKTAYKNPSIARDGDGRSGWLAFCE